MTKRSKSLPILALALCAFVKPITQNIKHGPPACDGCVRIAQQQQNCDPTVGCQTPSPNCGDGNCGYLAPDKNTMDPCNNNPSLPCGITGARG